MFNRAIVLYDIKRPKVGHLAIALLYAVPQSGIEGFVYSFGTSDDIGSQELVSSGKREHTGYIDKIPIPTCAAGYFKSLTDVSGSAKRYKEACRLKQAMIDDDDEKYDKTFIDSFDDIIDTARYWCKHWMSFHCGAYFKYTWEAMSLGIDKKMFDSLFRYDTAYMFNNEGIQFDKMYAEAERLYELSLQHKLKYSVYNGNCVHFVRYLMHTGGAMCRNFDYNVGDFFDTLKDFVIVKANGRADLRCRIPEAKFTDFHQPSPEDFCDTGVEISKVIREGVRFRTCTLL